MLAATIAGLAAGLSLIVAIGAQNAFVLRQGLRGEHVAAVVALCTGSDVVLIAAGVGGLGAVVQRYPTALRVVAAAGGLFLLGYAVLALRRARRPAALGLADDAVRVDLAATLATCAALTWLNPHVYLDTVLLLGSLAGAHGDQRWAFGAGAMLGSAVWFSGLGFGARWLRPVFTRPAAWRVLDAVIAVVMTVLAVSLLHRALG